MFFCFLILNTAFFFFFFFSSRRRHTRCSRDWSSDVCSSDLNREVGAELGDARVAGSREQLCVGRVALQRPAERVLAAAPPDDQDSHFFLLNASVNAWAARLAVSTTSFTTAFASFM